ncbi:NAD-dependent histone deacetylase HST3 [Lachnellula suecica]|uniref:NAD-dependent histone deacetylase HST3 n=1 Tax=Lachnellula suecica TaxID=602035 RepID=A0A8T9CA72_9HELO|nr:NAD-dependent histone deacetylase HST3 [Lachnellula suecica]
MPTINVNPGSNQDLQLIADTLGKSRKVVVVTGAGISTNCGIPDFRSEDGLYSMIQAQYEAALTNPPWENSNTFDIDDRPRKRAKPSYFYEVVAPDGRVVDVIHETPSASQSETQADEEPRRSLRSQSTTTSASGALTPPLSLSDSDVRSGDTEIPLLENNAGVDESSQPGIAQIHQSRDENPAKAIHVEPESTTIETKPPSRRSSRRARTQSDLTSIESSFVSTTNSITISEPFSSASPSRTQSVATTTVTCSTNTSITSTTSEVRYVGPRDSLQRQESSSKSDDDEPSATQSSQSSRTLPNLKGRDLFDSIIWTDPFSTSIFYMFISSLRNKIRNDVAITSETHNFIKVLRDGGRLVRNYTQNIDLLEERLGLCTDLSRGAGNRARFHYRTQREPRPVDIGGDSPHNGGVEVVLLHGSLGQLRCGICAKLSSWDHPEREAAISSGQAPDCPQCEDHSNKRTGRGRRSLAVGRLRPDIVLYGEEHPSADLVGPLITHDLGLGPDVMLIMGTSLKVHGLKVMVKEFAKSIHTRGGKVVFVNRTKPPESTWGDVIDYWVEWDCDAWVQDLKERREDIWLPQGSQIEEKRRDSSDDTKPMAKDAATKPRVSRPQATRDDKMNAVFATFKILDTLRTIPDSQGQTASRFAYWDKPAPRVSTVTIVEPAKKASSKSRKSLPAPATKAKATTVSKKRKSCPAQPEKPNREEELKQKMLAQWAEIRAKFPGLPELPRAPLKPISNNVELTGYQWSFHGRSNHFPSIGLPSKKSMLVSHPPSGETIPIHYSPKKKAQTLPDPPPISLSRPTNHAYKTRSSRRLSNADTIVVDDGEPRAQTTWSVDENTIVVSTEEADDKNNLPTPPQSGPLTPDSQRIKRMGSIGAILSSSPSEQEFHDALEIMT